MLCEERFKHIVDHRAVFQRVHLSLATLFSMQSVLAEIAERAVMIRLDPRGGQLHLPAEQSAGQIRLRDAAAGAILHGVDRRHQRRIGFLFTEIGSQGFCFSRAAVIMRDQPVKCRALGHQALADIHAVKRYDPDLRQRDLYLGDHIGRRVFFADEIGGIV